MLMTIGKQTSGDVVITSDALIRQWLSISRQIIGASVVMALFCTA